MSVTPTSTSSCTPNDNCNHETQQSMYSQRYFSPNYGADCKQVETFRNIILDESKKFYNKKVEEFTNLAVSEAAAYDNNQLSLTPDEKESIKELLPLKFTEYE